MKNQLNFEWFIRECPVCHSNNIVDDISQKETTDGVSVEYSERCKDCGTKVKSNYNIFNEEIEE